MVILNMDFEVPGKIFDALAEQRNLHFGRAGIRRMNSELLDHLFFLRFSNPHISAFFSLVPFSCIVSSTLVQACKAAGIAARHAPAKFSIRRKQNRRLVANLSFAGGRKMLNWSHREARILPSAGSLLVLPTFNARPSGGILPLAR